MSEKLEVMFIKPSFNPHMVKLDNNLTALQDMVMGYIEAIRLDKDFTAIVDEEGRRKGLDPNFATKYHNIVGNAVICRTSAGEFTSLKEGDEEKILKLIKLL